MAKINIGQNNSFMCSQVDSFTPENGAIHTGSPSQSYKKCNNVPPSEVIANPMSCQRLIDIDIISPDNILYEYYIYGDALLYYKKAPSICLALLSLSLN
jgi:hypothetical protein